MAEEFVSAGKKSETIGDEIKKMLVGKLIGDQRIMNEEIKKHNLETPLLGNLVYVKNFYRPFDI